MASWASPDGTKIERGHGTITDAAGGAWSLTADGRVQMGGADVSNGSGTAALTIFGGRIYGMDQASRNWFVYNGHGNWSGPMIMPTSGTALAAPTPPTPRPAPPTPPSPESSTAQLRAMLDQAEAMLDQTAALVETIRTGLAALRA